MKTKTFQKIPDTKQYKQESLYTDLNQDDSYGQLNLTSY